MARDPESGQFRFTNPIGLGLYRAARGSARLIRAGWRYGGRHVVPAAFATAPQRGRTLTRQDSALMPSRSRSRGRKRFRSRSGARRRGSSSRSGGSITTEQRDSGVRYVSRRGSRGGRRSRAFARRVQNVFLRLGALQTFSDTQGAVKSVTAQQQSWDGFIVGGTTALNNDILLQAFRLAYGTTLTSTNVDDYKLFVKTICTDFQFYNNGTKTMILDVYSLASRKSYNVSETLDNMMNTLIAETPAQTGFSFTATDIGYSLFQIPLLCQYWKIIKKTQVQLGAGETFTMQIRIPVNRMIPGKLIETNPQAVPRLSRGLLWSVKGAPESNAGNPQSAGGSYVWYSQTTCSYQIPPASSRIQVATT